MPISEITVGVPDTNGTLWVNADRTDTPRNMTPRIVLISTRVVRALRAWGLRKMLTPLEIASVPVMAELPLAKERRRKKADTPRINPPLAWPIGTVPDCAGWSGSVPADSRTSPKTISSAMLKMKKYVGMAKTRPASRMPRRLPKARMTTKAMLIATGTHDGLPRAGAAETMASAPAATDTATVMV